MKILGLLLLPLLLDLASCSTPKTIALTGEVASENVVASSTIFDVSFSHFTFNDTSYLVEVLPISAEHPSGYSFTHSNNLAEAANFSIESGAGSYVFKTKEDCQLKGGTFKLTLYAELSSLTIGGGIRCALSGVSSHLTITVDGAAKLTTPTPIHLNELTCTINGAADLSLSGSAEKASYSVGGTAAIKAPEFITKTTIVAIDGAGSAEVYASDTFQGSVDGTGSIVYHGNPTNVTKKVEGLGSINAA
jgi:hypothetical protein